MRDDYYSVEECIKVAEDSIAELKQREMMCDVKISDVIENNYKQKYNFFTPNHLANFIVVELLKRVFAFSGDNFDDFLPERAYELNGRMLIIYASVKKALKLEFEKNTFCWWYSFDSKQSSIPEYVQDYVDYCYRGKGSRVKH